jgi:hypothetical protein
MLHRTRNAELDLQLHLLTLILGSDPAGAIGTKIGLVGELSYLISVSYLRAGKLFGEIAKRNSLIALPRESRPRLKAGMELEEMPSLQERTAAAVMSWPFLSYPTPISTNSHFTASSAPSCGRWAITRLGLSCRHGLGVEGACCSGGWALDFVGV